MSQFILCRNYQIMRHPTPYPHQLQQILARILLTIWLPAMCSPEATVATSPSQVAAASTSPCAPGPSTPPMDTRETITLTAQGGHQVTFQQNNDAWQAEVDEHLSTGFSNKLHLPVSITEGMPWQQLATCSEALQRQRVVVDFTSESGQVYIDSRGLWRRDQPLYEVIKQGALALVPEILAEGGVDIHAVDDQGRSALHLAIIMGYPEIAALLLRHGANAALEDRQGKTPLDYADASNVEYFSTIRDLLQLFSELDGLIESSSIQNQDEDEIDHKLDEVCIWLRKLEVKGTQGIKQYRYFKHRYHIQNAKYLRALGDEEDVSYQEKLAAEYQEPDVSLLSLDADLQKTMAASSSTSDDADQFLNNQKDNISFYKKKGDDAWHQFMEYWYAQQGQWDLLTRLGRENLNQLSLDQKDAILAHEQYGASCHAAAKEQDLRSEINLRAIMALRLSIVGCFLEATMYALSIGSKLINSSSDIIVKDLRKARAVLSRVQEAQPAYDGRSSTTSSATNTLHALRKWNARIGLPCSSINDKVYADIAKIHIKYAIAQDMQKIARELLLSNAHNLARSPACDGRPSTINSPTNMFSTWQELSYNITSVPTTLSDQKEDFDTEKIEIKCAIAQDMQKIAQQLLPSSARNLARPHISEEQILQIEQLAKHYQQAGIGTGIVGGLLLCVAVGVGGYTLFKFIRAYRKRSTPSPKRIWKSVFAAATGILGWLALKYGQSLWNKGQELAACRGLNNVLAQGLTYHDQGNIKKVFDALSVPYATNKQLMSLEEIRKDLPNESKFPENKLVAILPKFGFGPDKIAYAYNLMGEALLSKAKTSRCTLEDDLILGVKNSFQCAFDEKLIPLAQDLDKKVTESPIKRYFQQWKNFLLLRDDARFLASIPHEDAPAMSVEQRLKAIGHIAKLNLTITEMDITSYKSQKEELALKDPLAAPLVKEAREAIEYYLQFYDMPPLRLAAIKDYLGMISDHILAITKPDVNHDSNAVTGVIHFTIYLRYA